MAFIKKIFNNIIKKSKKSSANTNKKQITDTDITAHNASVLEAQLLDNRATLMALGEHLLRIFCSENGQGADFEYVNKHLNLLKTDAKILVGNSILVNQKYQ